MHFLKKPKFVLGIAAVACILLGGVIYSLHRVQSAVTHTASTAQTNNVKTALLADGCFWCVEHDLETVQGVLTVESGYAGGTTVNPTYENYRDGGFREVVQVTYDSSKVSYANLVEHIIKHGDPTDANGSFYDRGPYYVPAIYYATEEEKQSALAVIAAVDAAHVFSNPLPLVVTPVVPFYKAEEYHQDYAQKNPLKYSYYRHSSGRDAFIEAHWGTTLNTFTFSTAIPQVTSTQLEKPFTSTSWNTYVKPSDDELKAKLTPLQYEVTQHEATEHPFVNEYDKNYEPGIYIDVVSGEPLFLSSDKYDSGSGWPSFVKPITPEAVVLREDTRLFSTRTEVRSVHADSHLGHVFDDGPKDRGGKRYCMNSAAMRFIAKADMESEGYGYLLAQVN